LEVLRENDGGHISDADLLAIFQIVESYVFRRYICELPTNSLNKIFLTLHNDVTHLDRTPADYAEKLVYVLHSKQDRSRFPDDDEFKKELSQKNIYNIPSKNKSYLFERIENGNHMENKNIYTMLDNGTCSVEHIMPQHLTPAWEKELGEDFKEIHVSWLHRLANLTLTAYNSKYSNHPFTEKRDMKDGFRESGFKMNQQISHREKWGLAEMEERNEDLATRALELWAFGKSNYEPPEKMLDGYSLSDDFIFTGKTIAKFTFRGAEQPAQNWADMYQKVLSILHQEDRSVLNALADNPDTGDLPLHVKRDADASERWWLIDEDIYIYMNTSTQLKINLLKKFFSLYDIACDDLMIYLREEDATSEDGETRFDVRMNYWTAALPKIRELTGVFYNVTPSKRNYISGASGYGGISYNLVANMDAARVELYIGTPESETNKKIYDRLYLHKTDIEGTYGSGLLWTRMNDKIASCIYVVLDKVSVSNENDWERMITFHAESCSRLKNVVSDFLSDAVSESKKG
jgi:hypothetical protein